MEVFINSKHTAVVSVSDDSLVESARQVIAIEADAVLALKNRVDAKFIHACRILLACEGRIVVSGMGKSGHIGTKIAATLASTGTPAFFVHPAEASHGDLGMITANDVVIAISNSGETNELLTILPLLKRRRVPLIAFTGNSNSTLAKQAEVHIDVGVEKEACPLGLAPTASTTATLAMGDALAVALLEARGFTREDFAYSHPGGSLGRRLLLRVEDIMHAGDSAPFVPMTASVGEALNEMTRAGLGFAAVVDLQHHVIGIFTDGDLRRLLDEPRYIHGIPIVDAMTKNCRTVKAHALVGEALQLMESKKVNALPVVDDENRLVGGVNMSDMLRAGVF